MPLAEGTSFAGYTIVRMLGSGGMGEVYLAKHPRLPRLDALKLLPLDVSGDHSFRERFNREADLAARLWHPHIVGVHDRGEYEGQIWIAMDFVDGTDAARLLADRYPVGMPESEVAQIVTAIASALDYAHKSDLLHRDVKPANIMLTHIDDEGEQRILLTDFGIAHSLGDISGLTTTNMTVGTVAYSAPEQLMGEQIDGRADEYALAATAYHLLTGSFLFPHSNPAVVISRHLNTPPPSLSARRPELAPLDPILAAALAKDPDGRFARCVDFARAFTETVVTQGEGSAAAPTTSAAAARRPPKPGSPPSLNGRVDADAAAPAEPHRIWLIPAAALAVLLLATALALAWQPWHEPQSPSATTTSIGPPLTATGSPGPSSAAAPAPPIGPALEPPTPANSPPPPSIPTYVAPTAPRVMDAEKAFSYVVPRGWEQADPSRLAYGSARLVPSAPPGASSYTEILLGTLDERLFASAEADLTTAAQRLASDMGEFDMPYPGTRINQQTLSLNAGGIPGAASYYAVRFKDTTRVDGQIWAAVIGTGAKRYFAVWSGTQIYPVDQDAAVALAESIRAG